MPLGTLDFRVPAPGALAFGAEAPELSLTIGGTFPALTGGALFERRASTLTISGTLPALTGAATLQHALDGLPHLDFSVPAPGRLNFGGAGAVSGNLTVSGTLPALGGSVLFGRRGTLAISGILPALTGNAHLGVALRAAGLLPRLTGRSYLAVPVYPPRGPACRVHPFWHNAQPQPADPLSIPWRVAAPQPIRQASPWNDGQQLAHRLHLPATQPIQQPIRQASPWNNASPLAVRIATQTDWPVQQPLRQGSPWNNAAPLAQRGDWGSLFPLITPIAIQSPWHKATPVGSGWHSGWRVALPMPQAWRSWWDSAIPPPPGIRYRPPRPKPPLRPQGRLDFRCPALGDLNFGPACFGSGGWLVPLRESYHVLNSGSLIRLSDGADIAVSSLTVSIDRESWCWSLRATLIGRVAADRAAERTEVEATINGFHWRFVIDSLSRSREFGKTDGRISGRSLAAWWSAPYNPTGSYLETEAKTAQQLALQVVPYGGFLDWQLPTWTVPGRVWQYQNLTPVEVLARLAKAAGGMIQSDPVDLKFWLSLKWPVKPWEWTTTAPFATLPSAYCTKEEREGIPGLAYDAIMVYGGVDSGIVCMATRAGEPGLIVAPPVTDSVIVDIEPAKTRAAQEIADLWPMRRFTVTLPLQAQPAGAGLILPGLFFDFSDGDDGWRGLAADVSITASFGKVTQTVTAVSV